MLGLGFVKGSFFGFLLGMFFKRFCKIIDLKKKSYIADYMIIASGRSERHLQSLSEIIVSELKKEGIDNCRIEGKESNDWKVVDAIDIIVHLFHPDRRKFYDLEKMWSEPLPKAKVVI